jgi:hypothetical protein
VSEAQLLNSEGSKSVRNALKCEIPLIAFPPFPQASILVDSNDVVNAPPVTRKANHDGNFFVVGDGFEKVAKNCQAMAALEGDGLSAVRDEPVVVSAGRQFPDL